MKYIKAKILIYILISFFSICSSGRGNVFPDYPELETFGQKFFENFSAVKTPTGLLPGENYILGQGDTLIITIWGFLEEEYQKEIESDNSIFLPKIGKIYPGGKTFQEAKEIIRNAVYRKYRNVTVSITAGELRTFQIFVLGEVKKPGSYEISSLFDIVEVLALAGGSTEKGSLRRIKLVRNDGNTDFFIDLYPFLLKGEKPLQIHFASGDTIFIPLAENLVGVSGAVRRPGVYEVMKRVKLKDVLELCGEFLPTADLSRLQIERKDIEKGTVLIDLSEKDISDFQLNNYDIVKIFSLTGERFYLISVEGAVKHPGAYGWKEGMKITGVLRKKDLLPDALKEKAEIARRKEDGSKKILSFSPEKLFSGDESQNLILLPQDKIIIYSTAKQEKRVIIQGKIAIPGEYVIENEERLSSLLERAGGFTSNAYLPGAVFMRESIRIQKEKQLKYFVQEKKKTLERETGRAQGKEEEELIEQGKVLLKQLKESKVKGRIILKLENLKKLKGSREDIPLESGDILYIPEKPVSVAIMGEVSQPANVLFAEQFDFKNYIEKAGDFTKDADRKNVFIVRADGSATRDLKHIQPGDTIVVPFEAKERLGNIIKDIVQMIYQVSLSIGGAK